MLGNHKTAGKSPRLSFSPTTTNPSPSAEQISSELSDLIPGEMEDSFLTWLFAELERHYPDPSKPAPALSPAAPAFTPSLDIRGTAPSTDTAPEVAAAAQGAVAGTKRGSREAGLAGPQAQRQRFDGQQPPTGPRNMNGLPNGPRNGPGGKSIFDRVGPAQGGGFKGPGGPPMGGPGMQGMPPQAFEAVSASLQRLLCMSTADSSSHVSVRLSQIAQTIQAVVSGATPPSSLAAIPFPALASHPHANRLPPQVMAQAQAHAVAQAQAFVAMQSAWGAPQGPGFGPPGPGFGQRGGFNSGPGRGGFKGPNGHGGHQQQQPHKPVAPAAPLPTEPKEEQICKHNVACSKPACPYSHSSPVATKESGLVLSSEHCSKGLGCEDPDCPSSHVSPAQKRPPPPSATPAASTSGAPAAAPAAADIAGAGEKACKFAGSCTRKGCVFLHPWDQRDGLGATGAAVPCRWGVSCTRAGCHFSHPPGRRDPAAKGGFPAYNAPAQTYNARSFSATFNGAGAKKPAAGKPAGAAGIGAWPDEGKDHVSDRLKRFAAVPDGEVEKIIPGETQPAEAVAEAEAVVAVAE